MLGFSRFPSELSICSPYSSFYLTLCPPFPPFIFFPSNRSIPSLFSFHHCFSLLLPSLRFFVSLLLTLFHIPSSYFSFFPNGFSPPVALFPYFYVTLFRSPSFYTFFLPLLLDFISQLHRFPPYWSSWRLSHQTRALRLPRRGCIRSLNHLDDVWNFLLGRRRKNRAQSRWFFEVEPLLSRCPVSSNEEFIRQTDPRSFGLVNLCHVQLWQMEIVWRREESCNFLLTSEQLLDTRCRDLKWDDWLESFIE